MIKIGEKLLIAVEVKSITQTSDGIFFRVIPIDKNRTYDSMEVIEKDIYSFLTEDLKGRRK